MMTFDIDCLYTMPDGMIIGDWPVKDGYRVVGMNHTDISMDPWESRFRLVSEPVSEEYPEDERTRRERSVKRQRALEHEACGLLQ